MSHYQFTTREFGISEEGFHLLRSGYNYKTIAFADTQSIAIGTGKQISNRLVALAFGIGLISVGLYVLFYACYAFYEGKVRVYVEQFAFAIIPLIVGIYALVMSLKKGTIIEFTVADKKTGFPIDEWRKSGQLEDLIRFLENNPHSSGKFRRDLKNPS